MSEQKRIMILGNYSLAFAGNREAVNAYTGEIFTNGAGSLDELNCDSDLKRLAFNLIHILPRRRSSNIRQE